MKRLIKNARDGIGLTYLLCEDWFIYAYDQNGNIYSVNTEMWPEWEDFSREQQEEYDALEKYILPIAKNKWNRLSWRNFGDENVWNLWGDLTPEQLDEKFKEYNIPLDPNKNLNT